MTVEIKSKFYAMLSGGCATVASMFGKLSGLPALEDYFVLRVVFFVLMVLTNLGVWSFYIKAMRDSSSSLPATVISASTNYLLSAVAGFLFFGEVTSLLWWTGGGLVLVGVVLIVTDKVDNENVKNRD